MDLRPYTMWWSEQRSVLLATYVFTINILNVFASDFKLVDLTHELSDATIYWPGNPAYNMTSLSRGQTNGGYWYETNYIAQSEHGGTHLDAPAHFKEGGWHTQQIPIERLHGSGVIIDVKEKCSSNPDYRVTVDDIMAWERVHGTIPKKAAVIMNSGWTDKYPNKTAVFSTNNPNDPSTFHFPGWHEDTVTWLSNNRMVRLIGVDTPSNDYGQSKTFAVHIVLARENICGVENVANLDKIPQRGAEVFVPVIKSKDGSGGPVRAFALIAEDDVTSNSNGIMYTCNSVALVLLMCVISLF